jgi:hypothetical protein
VVNLPGTSFGPDSGVVQDVSNRVMVTGGGGKPLKVVVHCQQGGIGGDPTTGRQLEVEFGIRFGI